MQMVWDASCSHGFPVGVKMAGERRRGHVGSMHTGASKTARRSGSMRPVSALLLET